MRFGLLGGNPILLGKLFLAFGVLSKTLNNKSNNNVGIKMHSLGGKYLYFDKIIYLSII